MAHGSPTPGFHMGARRREFDHERRLRANPAKVEDFGDKDLLQHIDLARILSAK
jgi:hypothetical protein